MEASERRIIGHYMFDTCDIAITTRNLNTHLWIQEDRINEGTDGRAEAAGDRSAQMGRTSRLRQISEDVRPRSYVAFIRDCMVKEGPGGREHDR